ncbi:Replicative DNA helicase [Balnearium lithotrophicum]|uniref:DNA 5'-3' helicase n=1 Tax=Balnearium lithotrophicum TaxID=223788 RepID=A0A521CQ81_9BACT|nr:DnaB-like helicase C-terminal domain-containing protein [Balnearium lithotrophicum]SMO61558.1 Replicative DNA helicase [Balnearium lithotrophicum]
MSRVVAAARDVELEYTVIGTMLVDEKAFYYGISRLRPDDFVLTDLQKIFSMLKEGFENGKTFEEATTCIPKEIANKKERESLESTLLYAVEFAIENEKKFKVCVEKLIESSKKRKELEIAEKLASGKITREEALGLLSDLERDRQEKGGTVAEVGSRWLEKMEEIYNQDTVPGIHTGSGEIDQYFSYRNELTLICARPSIGKTVTGLALALNQAKRGIKVQFFSLELTEEEVMARLISIHTGIPLKRIVFGWEDFETIVNAVTEIESLPLHIEAGQFTMPQIKARIFEVQPDIVYIDYVQIIHNHSKDFKTRKEFLDYASAELREISKNTCPVVALAQLNRGVRTGKDKPSLENIKETGNLEQDASNILLLHRNLKEAPDKLVIQIAKCRVNKAGSEIIVDFDNGFPHFTLSPATPVSKGEEEVDGLFDF